MDLTDYWKSLIPIDGDPDAPLLRSNSSKEASRTFSAPLSFNPKPQPSGSQLLFSSPSLCPPLLYPFPRFSLPRFLSTAGVPPSTSSSITTAFGSQNPSDDAVSVLSQNRLHFLRCPGKNVVLIFFPTGTNCDQVGFVLLSAGDSGLSVTGSEKGDVLVAKERFFSRIVRILVNPVDDFGFSSGDSLVTIGYVMVYTLYSIHWYNVRYSESGERPILRYLGCKRFKSCSIVGASWSPHLPEECVVLLENGALFLFDLNGGSSYFRGNRLKVSWDGRGKSVNYNWLGVEFSWHPNIFIVARSDAVFLVDKRFVDCDVTCLVEVETLCMKTSSGKEQFLAFSKAGTDSYQFVLASHSILFLCDVRNRSMPLLQWFHGVKKPCYIDVFSLSEFRLGVDSCDQADELASCIIMGSFWNSQFSMFCYGPSSPAEQSSASKVGEGPMSLYAYELPYSLLLSACECRCGDCYLKEQIMKDSLPDWIDWQQKKEIILGFGILNRYLPDMSLESDEFSGFTLIRLMSTGKLEAQKFCASWDSSNRLKAFHTDSMQHFDKENLLYLTDDGEYKFPKRFKYLELDYLRAYLDGNLTELLDSRSRKPFASSKKEKSFSLEFHEILCEKLNVCGLGSDRSSPSITAIFNDISLPTSIFEIALRQTWVGLPMELLLLAYSSYSEFLDVLLDMKKVSLEFLVVPDLPQLPPFFLRKPSCRSSKWSRKVQPCDSLVGPVLPLPVLLTLHEFRNGCPNSQQDTSGFSADVELANRCDQVSQVAKDVAISGHSPENVQTNETEAVSLADDLDDVWADNSQKQKPFIAYHPLAEMGHSLYEDKTLTTLLSRAHDKGFAADKNAERAGLDRFDDLSPVHLKFEEQDVKLGSQTLGNLDLFKMQFSLWQDRFTPYQEFLSQYNLQR